MGVRRCRAQNASGREGDTLKPLQVLRTGSHLVSGLPVFRLLRFSSLFPGLGRTLDPTPTPRLLSPLDSSPILPSILCLVTVSVPRGQMTGFS